MGRGFVVICPPEAVSVDVHFQCPHCRQPLVADTRLGGADIPCPGCRRPVPVPTITPDNVKELRLSLAPSHSPTPPPASHRPTLGEALPHAATVPETATNKVDDSTVLFTTVAAIVVLGLLILALFQMDKIATWFGRPQPPTQFAAARADAEFLQTVRDRCAQYKTTGEIRAQSGKAELQIDLPAEAAETLAQSLAVTYARARAAHNAGHGATVTVTTDDGKQATATATDSSPPVALPPPPSRPIAEAPVMRPAPPRVQPPVPVPTLMREDEESQSVTNEPAATAPAPASTSLPAGLLADSARGFSGTQGSNGWHYGYYQPPFTSDTFTEMPVFIAAAPHAWTINSNTPPSITLGRDACQTDPKLWPVRRWISPTNATINVVGQFRLAAGDADWNITARILVDGRTVFARPLPGADESVPCSARASVTAGSIMDIVIEDNSDSENPTVNYTVQMEVLPPDN